MRRVLSIAEHDAGIVIAFLACTTLLLAQQHAAELKPQPVTEDLTDSTFDWQLPSAGELVHVEVHVAPSFTPSSHLRIRFMKNGGATLEYLRVLDQPQAETPSDQGLETAPDPRKVKRYTMQVQFNQAQRWGKELWEAIADSQQTFRKEAGMSQLDGATYEIRVETSLSEQTLRVQDASPSPDRVVGGSAIVRWVNALIAELPI